MLGFARLHDLTDPVNAALVSMLGVRVLISTYNPITERPGVYPVSPDRLLSYDQSYCGFATVDPLHEVEVAIPGVTVSLTHTTAASPRSTASLRSVSTVMRAGMTVKQSARLSPKSDRIKSPFQSGLTAL